jgi:hypothetical protein
MTMTPEVQIFLSNMRILKIHTPPCVNPLQTELRGGQAGERRENADPHARQVLSPEDRIRRLRVLCCNTKNAR